MQQQYAVVFTYSFDDDCAVYLFQNLELAKEFLKSNLEEELRIELENGDRPTWRISEDGWTAEINNNGGRIFYHIGPVYA